MVDILKHKNKQTEKEIHRAKSRGIPITKISVLLKFGVYHSWCMDVLMLSKLEAL